MFCIETLNLITLFFSVTQMMVIPSFYCFQFRFKKDQLLLHSVMYVKRKWQAVIHHTHHCHGGKCMFIPIHPILRIKRPKLVDVHKKPICKRQRQESDRAIIEIDQGDDERDLTD